MLPGITAPLEKRMTEVEALQKYGVMGPNERGQYAISFEGQPFGYFMRARTFRKLLSVLLMTLENVTEQEEARILVPGKRTDG